jgi:hypothetical protein
MASYARRVFGATARGTTRLTVQVVPYACELDPAQHAALEASLATRFGGDVTLEREPTIAYGEEDAAARCFDSADDDSYDGRALLFALAATPESENHGTVIRLARDATERSSAAPLLLVVLDESAFSARFAGVQASARRLEERRALWRDFVAGLRSRGVDRRSRSGSRSRARARAGMTVISLSLISHTNVGKTTLARTLLRRDVGEIRDASHVTLQSSRHTLLETATGDALELWDTPGFGDSVRLLRRLELSSNPLGWFLSHVWDRYADRPFFSSQQALRIVRDHADVVLYLVNVSEDPAASAYVEPEMRILDWIGKPVIVVMNQLGLPDPVREGRDLERWRARLREQPNVRDVLAFDAFARCWVHEHVLLDRAGGHASAGRSAKPSIA